METAVPSTNDMRQEDKIVIGACQHDCPDNCSVVATVREGRVVGVRGNPHHPFTSGVLCAKVKSFEKRVYARDRLLFPMRRVGAKGEGKFARINWEEALGEIRDRLHGIISAHGAEAILPCSYLGSQGLLNGLHAGDVFFNALGAAIGERTFCNSGASKAFRMVCGPTGGLDPESFAYADLIILWAINVLSTSMHHWPFIARARERGAKLIVIDPLESRTARRADWHLRPKPGTDAALALALIHQIITDDRIDRDYIARHTLGFDGLKARAGEYTPAVVSAITGLSSEEIVKLARLVSGTKACAIRTGVALERTRNGPDAVRAIAALPAITGAWRTVGGGIFQHPGETFPIRRDLLAAPQLGDPQRRSVNLMGLADALAADAKPPVKALFVYNSNPVVACADQNKLIHGLRREDLFLAVSEIFPTDTTDYADILLPATSQVEQLDLMHSWGHFNLQLNPPAIEPVGEAVSNTELFRRLAATMGLQEPLLRRADEQIVQDAMDWQAPALAGIDLGALRERGFARLNVGDASRRRPHAEGNFPTPSGKCELESSLADEGGGVLPMYRQGCAAPPCDAVDPLPKHRPLQEDSRFPFRLLSPKNHFFLTSGYANLEYQADPSGPQRVEIHPDDAAKKGIANGEMVRVFNTAGEVRATARVTTATLPGVVVIPHGFWRKLVGGATVNALVRHRPADIGQGATPNDTKVAVEACARSQEH
jgi:anaerobic selenocysteine-containing dehydrogenase